MMVQRGLIALLISAVLLGAPLLSGEARALTCLVPDDHLDR